MLRGRAARQEHPRQAVSISTSYLHRGAGAYICGEETGLIESLEGKRAWPRIKPPFPAVEGAFRKPTIVNNVETLACVTHIVDRGVDWFKSIGVPPDPKNPRDAGSYGPKLYCISGHVNKPGCVELPLGVTVRELVDKHGGGVWKGRKAKAVRPRRHQHGLRRCTRAQTATSSTRRSISTARARSAASAWARRRSSSSTTRRAWSTCSTTSAGSSRTNRAASARRAARAPAGCRRSWTACAAARAGARTSTCSIEVADRMGIMPGTTICGLADGAGWPVKNAIRKFRGEFEAAIKSGAKSQYAKSLALVGAH